MKEIEFEHIVSKMRPKLKAHCQNYIDTATLPVDADDIVQEALVRLWKMRDKPSTNYLPRNEGCF